MPKYMATQERINAARQRLGQIRSTSIQPTQATQPPLGEPGVQTEGLGVQAPPAQPQLQEQARERLTQLRTTQLPTPITPITHTPVDLTKKVEKPKTGIRGFAETIGAAIQSPLTERFQKEVTERGLELQPQIMRQLRDPNISRARKLRLAKSAGIGEDIIGQIPGLQKTTGQVAAEALGTLGLAALPAAPVAGLTGRLVLGAGVGAGAGLEKGLREGETAAQIAKRTAIGAGIGLAAGGVFEGLAKGVRLFGQIPAIQKGVGKEFTRVLRPPTKDLSRQLEFNLKTVGDQVAGAVDDVGKPIYFGGTNKIKRQAQQQVVKKGGELDDVLQTQFGDIRLNKSQVKNKVVAKLEDDFGILTTAQKKTIDKELIAIPGAKFDLKKANDLKRKVSERVPSGFWLDPNSQRAFVGNTRYNTRTALKELIEENADDQIVRALNNEMGLALEVRGLAATQQAIAQKSLPFNIQTPNIISGVLRSTIFSPKITTRLGQATLGRPTGILGGLAGNARPLRTGAIQLTQ